VIGTGGALRAAFIDFYHQSWRLAAFNTVLSVTVLAVVYLTWFVHPAFVLLVVGTGPLAASLMHCAVSLAQDDELHFADALVGLRLHWGRGLVLASATLLVFWFAVIALRFYGTDQWIFAVFVADVLVLVAILQLLVWPRAVHERNRPLQKVLGDALTDFLSRPLSTLGFGAALTVVNVVGFAAGVMPFLTLTIAFSFVAAAHFALPRSPVREPLPESL
jgi:hypothetical protein